MPNISWYCFLFHLFIWLTYKATIIICKLSFFVTEKFAIAISNALNQFKEQGYTKKLKSQITSDSMPADIPELIVFLYYQICIY